VISADNDRQCITVDMSKWIGLRDTGTETALCVKEIRSHAIDGTLEVETAVGDFAAAREILGLLGFTPKFARRTGGRAPSSRTSRSSWTSGL
jgi:adenylate cyclase, class 2